MLLRVNRVLAIVFAVIGVALVVETATRGGGATSIGYLAGAAFLILAFVRWRVVRPRR